MSAVRAAQRRAVITRAMPKWSKRWPGIGLGTLADACVVGLLALSMWLIVRAGEQPPILYLTFAIVGVRAFAIGRAAFRYAERIVSHDAALGALATLRASTFEALVPRVPGAIESHRRGEVLAAFVDDVDQLQDEPLRVRQPLLVSLIVVGLSIVAVGLASPLAAVILLFALGAFGGGAILLARRMTSSDDYELSAARAELIDVVLEHVSSAEVLAAFGALPQHRARVSRAERRLSQLQLRRSRTAGLTGALLSLGAGVATLLILVAVLPQIGSSDAHGVAALSAPLFAAVVVVPAAVFEVFAQVPAALVARRGVEASAERVAALTEAPIAPEIVQETRSPAADAPGTARSTARGTARSTAPGMARSTGRDAGNDAWPDAWSDAWPDAWPDAWNADTQAPLLQVTELAVRYPGASDDTISGLSFSLNAGESLVVRGPSGSGKSTLAAALVRFLEYRGSYQLHGVEARSIAPSAVRRIVGLCEQTPHLFDADLRQNLKFARDTASDEELLAVLERVGLGSWVRERGGLDAAVGERGSLVSGGQAQRIALARAILADFPVVVFDEPTAGVDREVSDRLITDLLGSVPDDRAVILITHTALPDGVAVSASLELTGA